MPAKPKTVGDYLRELKGDKKGKPPQIKEALEMYVEMWDKILDKGIVSEEDGLEAALAKIDGAGGLYEASS